MPDLLDTLPYVDRGTDSDDDTSDPTGAGSVRGRPGSSGQSFFRPSLFRKGENQPDPVESLQRFDVTIASQRATQLLIREQLEDLWRRANHDGLVLDREALIEWLDEHATAEVNGQEHVASFIDDPSSQRKDAVLKQTIGRLDSGYYFRYGEAVEGFGTEVAPSQYLINQGVISALFGLETRFLGLARREDGTTEIVIAQ